MTGVGVTSYVILAGRTPAAGEPARKAEAPVGTPVQDSATPLALTPREEADRVSPTGLHGRPKEQGDRFQSFALQASETKWEPEADPETRASIEKRESRIAELIRELSADFVTEPLEEEFKLRQVEYRTGKSTPRSYLETLEGLQKVLRRPAKSDPKGEKP
jgi:hypothetical protein